MNKARQRNPTKMKAAPKARSGPARCATEWKSPAFAWCMAAASLVSLLGASRGLAQQQEAAAVVPSPAVEEPWVAPEAAARRQNPVAVTEQAVTKGKEVYMAMCVFCHGPLGRGDGVAAPSLPRKPANLSAATVQQQADGAIFWKITTGRTPMPPFAEALPEEQRWQLVNFIRTLRTASVEDKQPATNVPLEFPLGTATPSLTCGTCHKEIYREYATGAGADLKFSPMIFQSMEEKPLTVPSDHSATATAHSLAGVDPFPLRARTVEDKGMSCDVCHFPQPFEIPDLDRLAIPKPKPRPLEQEAAGITCASCHLTPDGKIRGPHDVKAPHATVADARMQTGAMCATCHSEGERIVGKQTQTFLEWREDFHKPGLGAQQCQDCHMPRVQRKTAEDFDVPVRTVARHTWTGGHSAQRLKSALSLAVGQPHEGEPSLEFHVINIGAGHSVPTGSNRRAVYLQAEIVDDHERTVASKEWTFAPWYGDRADDRAFLEADKNREDALAAIQADTQGPHETLIRAGEKRVLSWLPELQAGEYMVRTRLVYDLNRYNDRAFTGDQTELCRSSLPIRVKLNGNDMTAKKEPTPSSVPRIEGN